MIFILKQTEDQFPSSIHLKGLIAMTNSIPTNNHQGSLEKWLITRLRQEMYKMSLKYLVTQNKWSKITGLVSKGFSKQLLLAKIRQFDQQ